MGNRKNRWPPVFGVGLVLLAIGWAVMVGRLPAAGRADASTYGQFILALVGTTVLIVDRVFLVRTERLPAPEALADLLASVVRGQWSAVAAERRLLIPDPIPIRWSLMPAMSVAGLVSAAVRSSAFAPLPGLSAVTEADLRAGGRQSELFAVYAGLGSGRLVIAGAPGAGKSGSAIRILLDALDHRAAQRPSDQVPVPVLLSLRGWNPAAGQPVEAWLADRLSQTYPMFAGRRGRRKAELLVAAGALAIFLDGLDEIPEALRPSVLEALSLIRMRMVLLTRTAELVEATADRFLLGAVAVQLNDVAAADGADYLERSLTGPPPAGWAQLLVRLRHHPESNLARGLASPLALTLVRDTYRSTDDVSELLDLPGADPAEIEDHLLGRVVAAAYAPRAGRPTPRYGPERAGEVLAFIAARMARDGTTELAWWDLPGWAPTLPRAAATAAFWALMLGPVDATGDPGTGGPLGPLIGLALGGLFGLVIVGIRRKPEERVPLRFGPARWRTFVREYGWTILLVCLVPGIALASFGLAGGLGHGPLSSPEGGLVGDPVAGLFGGFILGFLFGGAPMAVLSLVLVHEHAGADRAAPMDPVTCWRSDRLYGGVVGVVLGALLGLVSWEFGGLRSGVVVAIIIGLPGALTFPTSWLTCLTFVQLRRRHGLPIRLLRFCEDARGRDVLRTLGPVYQFRHARLQELLATGADRPARNVAGPDLATPNR